MTLFLAALALLSPQEPRSYSTSDRLVFVYYRPGDAPVLDFSAMGRAGFDVALIVTDGERDPGPLVAALETVTRSGIEPPRLAPCLELAPGADPAKAAALAVKAFDAAVPPRLRAHVDGRALLWLLPSEAAVDPAAFEGFRPYLVADHSWKGLAADRVYAWGSGPRDYGAVSLPGGGGDAAHEKAWFAALRLEARWIAVETWEAIVEQPERGKQRLEALQRLIRKHKVNERNALPKGKWTGAEKALFTTKYHPHEQGLRPVEAPDGAFDLVQLRGLAVLASKENPSGPKRTLCFDVDDSFHYHERRSFELTLEFLDVGEGSFRVEYDAADRSLALPARHFRPTADLLFTGTGGWREERVVLPGALFGNNQPGGADFRIVLDGRGILLRRVALNPR